jgi:alanyl-tRNA synthetase
MALFGEKYGDQVRTLRIGEFSVELCGGTHVRRTGDIGWFKIVSEGGVAAGIRRIEAITGEPAVTRAQQTDEVMRRIADLVKGDVGQVEQKVAQLIQRMKEQDKEIQALKTKLAAQSGRDITETAVTVGNVRVLSERIDGADIGALRSTMDSLKARLGQAAIVLGAVEGDKVRLVAGVTKGLSGILHAGELVNFVAQQVDGKGGGRPDMAQAGGNDPTKLDAALASVPQWVEERLQS